MGSFYATCTITIVDNDSAYIQLLVPMKKYSSGRTDKGLKLIPF